MMARRFARLDSEWIPGKIDDAKKQYVALLELEVGKL
jgi:hypothetical protein